MLHVPHTVKVVLFIYSVEASALPRPKRARFEANVQNFDYGESYEQNNNETTAVLDEVTVCIFE